jgi:putative ABC transport system permease protein
MTGFLQDLRYAYRMLIKDPGFTAVVVVALGLGIGANTMIFSVVNAVLMKRLPFHEPERIVALDERTRADQEGDGLSFLDMIDVRERAHSLEGVSSLYESQAYLTLGREPERFNSAVITPGLFKTLGVAPLIGREFVAEEGVDGKQYGAVMISHRLWSQRLGSDPKVLGRTYKMNGRVRTVVGVVPPGIRFPENADFWTPLAYKPSEETRADRYLETVARLAPGASLDQVRAELAGISRTLERDHPETNQRVRFTAELYRDHLSSDVKPPMIMLMLAVVFVLLIACANVANLMLARSTARQRELSLRVALGAGRGRIARQLLTECLLISLVGGLLGVLIAYWGNDVLLGTIPVELPYWMTFGIDRAALLFTLAVSIGSALAFGLAPVLHLPRTTVYESLKDGGTQVSGGRGQNRMRSGLVVAEIALALVLLAGAGLMMRSFLRMEEQRSGIDAHGVLTGRITLPVAVYKEDVDRRAFYERVLPSIAALPGVVSASAVANLPLGNSSWSRTVQVEGTHKETADLPVTTFGAITPAYFATLRIPFRAGRDFSAADDEKAPLVAIVNRSAARRLWPGKDPLGQRFNFGSRDTAGWRTVVGVVEDVRQSARSKDEVAQVFVPHAQFPIQTMCLLIRAAGSPGALAQPVRRLLQSRDPDLPFYEVHTMDEWVRIAVWEPKLYAGLMGAFALIALVIAGVGIYGVMAYSVAQRTQEIGIRMAMGAARGAVLRMVIGQGMTLAGMGLGIGLAVAFAITRLMASLLFGVSASDPPTFLGVIVILAGSALLACWLPALRATRVDPMVALRQE